MSRNKKTILSLLSLFVIIYLVYKPLTNGYFIQDEWQLFSIYYSFEGKKFLDVILSFLIPQPGQFVPITQIISYTMFYFFKLNYHSYLFLGLLLHFSVGVLLWKLLLNLTKSSMWSLLAVIFFLVTPSHFQATSWVVANIGYSVSAALFLCGLIFYFKWLEFSKAKFAIFASLFLFLSLFAKEITLFIFIALPIVTYIWKRDWRKVIQTMYIIFPILLFSVWRYSFLAANPLKDLNVGTQINLFNIVLLPIRALAQSLFPQEWIYGISRFLVLITSSFSALEINTTAFESAVETTGAAVVVLLITAVIFLIGRFLYKLDKGGTYFKLYLIGLILSAFSGLPYIFVDTAEFGLLQPRYTYIGVLCVAISIVSILISLKKQQILTGILFSFVLVILAFSTFKQSVILADIGNIRKNILVTIASKLPENSENILLYIGSDESLYGLPSEIHVPPFQSGLGKILGVYLNDKVYIPNKVRETETLWPLTSQGYYNDGNKGFGYFRDLNLLQNTVKNYSIRKENVFAFYWFGDENVFKDVTDKVREEL